MSRFAFCVIVATVFSGVSCEEGFDNDLDDGGEPELQEVTPDCVKYVDGTVASSGDGNSWEGAFKTVEEGVDAAEIALENYGECEVWVSDGNEKALGAVDPAKLKDMSERGVRVFTDFQGTESVRKPSNRGAFSPDPSMLEKPVKSLRNVVAAVEGDSSPSGISSNLNSLSSAVLTGPLDNPVVCSGSSPWWEEAGSNKIYYNDGNVGITNETSVFWAQSRLHVRDLTPGQFTVLIEGPDNNGSTGAGLKITHGNYHLLLDGNEIDTPNGDLLINLNNSRDVEMVRGGGRVGIGATNAPQSKLHIIELENGGTANGSGAIRIVKSDATKTLVMDSNEIDTYGSGLYLNLNSNSKVGIALDAPADLTHTLTVNGTVKAEEIIIDTVGADFVFEDGYCLMPLEEVDAYVQEHDHLPGIASAAEMQTNGVGVSELQTQLLQKIEELTLYAIEQNNRLVKLERENKELQAKLLGE